MALPASTESCIKGTRFSAMLTINDLLYSRGNGEVAPAIYARGEINW